MDPSVTRDELKRLIEKKADVTLIDVRERYELARRMIPTAKS